MMFHLLKDIEIKNACEEQFSSSLLRFDLLCVKSNFFVKHFSQYSFKEALQKDILLWPLTLSSFRAINIVIIVLSSTYIRAAVT